MRFVNDASELDHAALQVDDEEDVAASEAAQCQDLNRAVSENLIDGFAAMR